MAQQLETPPTRDPGEELQRTQQYVQLWRLNLRLEYLMLLAIGVFALTIAKMVIVDLWMLPTAYRTIGFIGLGVVLLAGLCVAGFTLFDVRPRLGLDLRGGLTGQPQDAEREESHERLYLR